MEDYIVKDVLKKIVEIDEKEGVWKVRWWH